MVVTNPDDVVTSATFSAWLDELQSGDALDLDLRAADTLRELRTDGEA